jgi:ectoine hydroxylase-related dioxygenase (phytanoyl-CoA dioxygenase family)
LIRDTLGPDYFVVKFIYFDKPPSSNWFVAWHQDLTISVDRRLDVEGYAWTVKQGQYSVQPPLAVLESIYTIRIHLDDTNEQNGALRVIPGSHRKGVISRTTDRTPEKEISCSVGRGGEG